MAMYKLKDGAASGFLPGVGRVLPGMLVQGDYARFVPSVLQEVTEPVASPEKKSSAPQPVIPVIVQTILVPEEGPATVGPEERVELPLVEEPVSGVAAGVVSEAVEEALAAIDLPAPDTMARVTSSASIATPQPPQSPKKGGKKG